MNPMTGVATMAGGDFDPSNPPIGFRFNPKDEEIVEDFLIPMMSGGRLGFGAEGMIHYNIDVYSSEPWNLLPASSFKHGKMRNEAFFLIQRKPCSAGARVSSRSHVSRAVKDQNGNYKGCWLLKGHPKKFHCSRSGVKAKKTTSLVFKTPDGISTDWLMQEYCVLDAGPNFQHMAICKIYHNKASKAGEEEDGQAPHCKKPRLVSQFADPPPLQRPMADHDTQPCQDIRSGFPTLYDQFEPRAASDDVSISEDVVCMSDDPDCDPTSATCSPGKEPTTVTTDAANLTLPDGWDQINYDNILSGIDECLVRPTADHDMFLPCQDISSDYNTLNGQVQPQQSAPPATTSDVVLIGDDRYCYPASAAIAHTDEPTTVDAEATLNSETYPYGGRDEEATNLRVPNDSYHNNFDGFFSGVEENGLSIHPSEEGILADEEFLRQFSAPHSLQGPMVDHDQFLPCHDISSSYRTSNDWDHFNVADFLAGEEEC